MFLKKWCNIMKKYKDELKNDKGKYGQFPKGFLKRVKEVI